MDSLSFKSGVPNLFTILYYLATLYCQRAQPLADQLIGLNPTLFGRIIYIKITIKDHHKI